jgi:hypothetical protein
MLASAGSTRARSGAGTGRRIAPRPARKRLAALAVLLSLLALTTVPTACSGPEERPKPEKDLSDPGVTGIDTGDPLQGEGLGPRDARKPRLEGRTWVIPDLGFTLTIPERWYRRRVNDVEVISEPPNEADHPANMAVQRVERKEAGFGETLAAAEKEMRGLPDVILDEAKAIQVSGRDVGVLRWHGKFPANPDPVRGWTLLYLLGEEHEVILVSSVLESKFQALGPVIEASLASLKLGEPARP